MLELVRNWQLQLDYYGLTDRQRRNPRKTNWAKFNTEVRWLEQCGTTAFAVKEKDLLYYMDDNYAEGHYRVTTAKFEKYLSGKLSSKLSAYLLAEAQVSPSAWIASFSTI